MIVNTFSSKQVTKQDGSGRHYEIREHDGSFSKHLKSVTTQIGYHEDKTALFEWRDRVGTEEANRISNTAATTGTKIHSLIEKYLLEDIAPYNDQSIQYACFSKIEQKLLPLTKPLGIELTTYWWKEGIGGFAGNVDLVTQVDASKLIIRDTKEPVAVDYIPVIMDYKTWTTTKTDKDGKVTYKTKEPVVRPYNGEPWYPFIKYCVQLAAYSAALNQRTNCSYPFNKAFIVGITPTCRQPFVYYINPESLQFYWEWMQKIIIGYANQVKVDWKLMERLADEGGYLPLRCDII